MSTILPAVARSIYFPCKKCGVERYFKVIAHTSATTAKIKCEVCGASKSYDVEEVNRPASEQVARVKRTAKAKSAAGEVSSTWLTLKQKNENTATTGYKITHKFSENDLIQHPVFGLGFVTRAYPAKIEVLFANGIKELIHSKS